MFEFICMSLLGICYVHALIKEAKEEKEEEKTAKELSVALKIFRYSLLTGKSTEEIMKLLKEKKLYYCDIVRALERKDNEENKVTNH